MANNNATLVFGLPGALNDAVVGSERETGRDTFFLTSRPQIVDATHEVDPAATVAYDFGIKRGNSIHVIASTVDMLRSTKPSQGLRPNMPTRPILSGQFQFVVQQRAGTLAATNIRLVTTAPIV